VLVITYQQDEQSLLTLTELTKHKTTTTCDIENTGTGFGLTQNVHFELDQHS
jgi:hypothetical protein